MKRILYVCGIGFLAVLARDAGAVDNAACCLANTSRTDSIMNPVQGGDEKLFTTNSGPPTIIFLVGNNQSMQDYVVEIPSGTANSCADTDPLWGSYSATA